MTQLSGGESPGRQTDEANGTERPVGVYERAKDQQTSRPAHALWGLSTRQLHDAWWASRGVQCVRRGESQRLERAAELFLLIDPDQLVMFHLPSLRERLMWNNAAVMRLRLVDKRLDEYSERVVTNAEGCVDRIERNYGARGFASARVMLTTSKRLASIWMHAPSRRAGWDLLRRSVPWLRVDHLKTAGMVYEEGEREQERRFLDQLVERWRQPGQAIEGISEIEPDVWAVDGETINLQTTRVGPLWLGLGAANDPKPCIVGPSWHRDRVTSSSLAKGHVRVRPIADVEPVDASDPVAVPRQSVLYPVAKRAFDIVFSLCVLIGFAPLFVIVAILILLEDGRPLFFGHVRQGRGGRLFKCWKFRTMVPNAEEIADELGEYNLCDGPQVYIQDDPRVTRIGHMLRNTQLDELPQFWNVLVGHMSVVGPRPSPVDENVFCPAWRDARLSVRPGITGLWQLMRTRKPGEDFREWIKFDLRYVKNASFFLDLKIIVKTAMLVLGGRRGRAAD